MPRSLFFVLATVLIFSLTLPAMSEAKLTRSEMRNYRIDRQDDRQNFRQERREDLRQLRKDVID